MRRLLSMFLAGCAYGAPDERSFPATARPPSDEASVLADVATASATLGDTTNEAAAPVDAAVEVRADETAADGSTSEVIAADARDSASDTAEPADVLDAKPSADASVGKTWIVTVKSTQFVPDYLKIKPGDTIELRFLEGTHEVVSGDFCTSDGLFTSGTHTAPYTFSFTYPKKGYYTFFDRRSDRCTLYGMYAEVDVVP